jgi:hypothetical protein
MGVRSPPGMRMIQSQGIPLSWFLSRKPQNSILSQEVLWRHWNQFFKFKEPELSTEERSIDWYHFWSPFFHWTFIQVSQQTYLWNIFGLHFHLNYTKAMSFLTHIIILCTTIVIDLLKNTMSIHECTIIPFCKKTKILATCPLYLYNNKNYITNHKLA